MRPQTIDAQRGRILDRNHKTLAISVGADAVYALPDCIRDAEGTARQLAPYLSMSEKELVSLLTSDKTSVWIARGLTVEVAEAIRSLGLPGIRLVQRPQRYYPQGSLAAHVIGIAGADNKGLEGIEYFYDEILSGIPGQQAMERDAAQRSIPGGETQFVPPQPGHDVVLTIDSVIQYIAETRIQEAVTSSKSERGLVLVMNPKTGEILADAIYPSFDPNNYKQVSAEFRRNVAVTDQYEPGSTFKFVTAAAALDLGITDFNRKFESSSAWEVGGGRVRNLDGRAFGTVTFKEAIERSDNITFAKLSVEMGPERFHKYIQALARAPPGRRFPGEISALWRSQQERPDPAVGQHRIWPGGGCHSSAVITAISAVANGGTPPRPYFVKEIRDVNGRSRTEDRTSGPWQSSQPADCGRSERTASFSGGQRKW